MDGSFVIDHTSLAMFKDCPKKYYLGILNGYRPKQSAPPLTYGKVFHTAVEVYDREKGKGLDHDLAVAKAVQRAWKDSKGDATFTLDSRRSIASLIRAVIWYADTWKDDYLETLVLPNGKPAVELSFTFELPFTFAGTDAPVLYCGHIDRVAKYRDDLFAVEHKHTVSALSDSYWNRYVFGSQTSGYVMALKVNFNLNTAGAIIDATQVGVNFARFGRRPVHRVETHQQEWMLDLSYWLSQLDLCLTTDRWPRNTEACSKYSGCQFRDYCFSRPMSRDLILAHDFKIEKWDPLKIRGED